MAGVQRLRVKLMLAHPFLASAIARLPIVQSTETSWCATTATDGYHVFVDGGFVSSLSDDDGLYVLAHTYLHAILGHADRRQDRDRALWNAASDLAVNQALVEFGVTVPAGVAYESRFRGQTAEAIYEEIAGRLGSVLAERAGWSGARERVSAALPVEQRRRLVAHAGWDLHLDPSDPEAIWADVADMPTQLERRRIREDLVESIRSAAHGRQAGFLTDEIAAATDASVPWEMLLAQFVSGVRRSDYRLYPFNRKHVHRGMYLPTVGAPGPQYLVSVIDTSGSISSALAGRFLAEVDRLRSVGECLLTVLQVDEAVQWSRDFDPWDPPELGEDDGRFTLRGRGGTDFRPAFEWVAARAETERVEPDAVIYLTDGYGTFPSDQPNWPVLWVVTREGLADDRIPFGSTIRLPRALA